MVMDPVSYAVLPGKEHVVILRSPILVSYDLERLSGLASMLHPPTAGELMQFLQAVNWWRTSLPRLAEVVELLLA